MPSFHSPDRTPYARDRPGYPPDKPIAALPGLIIVPEPNGRWHVTIFLMTGSNTSRPFYGVVDNIGELCEAYASDPEGTMKSVFGYTVPKEAPKAQRSTPSLPSLSDLGL